MAAAELGGEIIEGEILPRLPVKSLIRFKSVCRSWQALISHPRFVAAHVNRSKNNIRSLAIVPSEKHAVSLYRLSPGRSRPARLFRMRLDPQANTPFTPFTRIQHSNGLLLLLGARRELVVCNPSTGQHELLPQGSPCEWACPPGSCLHGAAGIGFVPGANVFKVARFCNRSSGPRSIITCFEVLTLGIDSSWRATHYPPHPIDPLCTPVSASGGMFYFRIDSGLRNEFVLSFDLGSETFAVIPAPPRPVRRCRYWLQEMDGTLCFIQGVDGGGGLKVWMYTGDTWDHAFTIGDLSRPFHFYLVGARHGGKVLLCTDDGLGGTALEYYDPASKSLTCAAELEENSFVSRQGANNHPMRWTYSVRLQVISYVESLVPVPVRRPAASLL